MTKLRLGLTISGAISLGAYEGGALAALLVAVQNMGGAVAVDAITGASAGAITAVLAAHSLLRGTDPVQAMVSSWVDLPDLAHLATTDPGSPLSAKVLTDSAQQLLDDLPDGPLHQTEPIRVSLTLASLGGFGYRIRRLEGDEPVEAATFLDWVTYRFDPATATKDYKPAAQAALASAANALGFPPKLLERSAEDVAKMVENGILNPPKCGAWYTDGGTIDNEPLGRLIDLAGEDETSSERLFLLIHPLPGNVPADSIWVHPDEQPRWSRTALRANKLKGSQTTYDDLRRLEKTNQRIKSLDLLVRAVGDAVTGPENAAARASLAAALRGTLDALHAEHVRTNEIVGRAAPHEDAATRGLTDTGASTDADAVARLLRAAISQATGLSGKRPVKVDVISPALDESGLPAHDLLAGERLGHFFGFAAQRLRRNDFAVGYRNMRRFLAERLALRGLADEVAAALPAVDAGFAGLAWPPYDLGDAGFDDLHWHEKERLVRLGGHVAHVVENDVRHWNEGLPVHPED
jgi:predicted acylesterase/phospholipase RssA